MGINHYTINEKVSKTRENYEKQAEQSEKHDKVI